MDSKQIQAGNVLIEGNKTEISEESLFEHGFLLRGFDYFYNPETEILVKMVTQKSGKITFNNNSKRVNYIEDLSIDKTVSNVHNEEGLSIKLKAYKGDALIKFFARELLCTKTQAIPAKYNRETSSLMLSNSYLKEVCIFIGMANICESGSHGYGTTYEANIYDIYLNDGFEKAFEYFKNTVYKYYLESTGSPQLVKINNTQPKTNTHVK